MPAHCPKPPYRGLALLEIRLGGPEGDYDKKLCALSDKQSSDILAGAPAVLVAMSLAPGTSPSSYRLDFSVMQKMATFLKPALPVEQIKEDGCEVFLRNRLAAGNG